MVLNQDLKVAPNPFSDYIDIDLQFVANDSESWKYTIINSMGQPVKKEEISQPTHRIFNLSNLPRGIYLLINYTNK